MADFHRRLAKWRHFWDKGNKEAPPGGWAKFLGATWLPKAEWFPRYKLYLESWAWMERRKGALRRAGDKCQLCPATKRLEVHHVTYDRVGAEPITDLRVVCKPCHDTLKVDRYIPPDPATQREARQRLLMREQKAQAKRDAKPKTRRRAMPVAPDITTPPLKDRC